MPGTVAGNERSRLDMVLVVRESASAGSNIERDLALFCTSLKLGGDVRLLQRQHGRTLEKLLFVYRIRLTHHKGTVWMYNSELRIGKLADGPMEK
jgi:hypothetical protein